MTFEAQGVAFKVAAAQLCSTTDLRQNLETCRELAKQAADQGATLFALPECFAFVGTNLAEKLAIAEPLARPGPILEAVRDMARLHSMWVVAGGVPERPAEDDPAPAGRVYNTCLLLDPRGDVRAAYRKIHLFDVAIPGKAELRESASTAPGSDVIVAETPLARLGLSVCYDVRFPELYRELAARGAEVLMVPSAFTAHTGAAHWHTLLRARAIENQCFVVAPAQAGQHSPARASFGHSIVIDPWGVVLAELAEGTGLAVAEIDLAVLARVRREMPCQSHRVLGLPT